MASKNKFDIYGNTVHISRDGWDKLANTTFREDYIDELMSVTWGISNGYIYSQKLGYLHRYIMGKWYGNDMVEKMTSSGFVVDHMNNDSFDCEISNLCFLSSDENKAKGFTVDKQSHELRWDIALNMFKDFDTSYFQITIFFNKTMYLVNSQTNESYPASSLKLLYNKNYDMVINDARYILLSYKESGKFGLSKLNFVEYKIEKAHLMHLNEEDRDKAVIEIDGKQYLIINEHTRMLKINYDKGWTPKNE
ncbi:MAG: hypothetical protein PHV32_04470 [Eubacteriales bacterium]|nr:hypothetical protein [Eubacteriales bacterium]